MKTIIDILNTIFVNNITLYKLGLYELINIYLPLSLTLYISFLLYRKQNKKNYLNSKQEELAMLSDEIKSIDITVNNHHKAFFQKPFQKEFSKESFPGERDIWDMLERYKLCVIKKDRIFDDLYRNSSKKMQKCLLETKTDSSTSLLLIEEMETLLLLRFQKTSKNKKNTKKR